MKILTTERHYRKYSKLAKLWGISFRGCKTILGKTPEQMTAVLLEDKNLNLIPLRQWDILGAHLVGKPHDLDVEGESDGLRRRCSQAEAVCVVKHCTTYHFCGALPDFGGKRR